MFVWSDRLGLLLQFVAFWLIAPELIGQSRLHRLRRAVTKTVEAFLVVPVGVGLSVIGSALLLRYLDRDLHNVLKASLVALMILGISLAGYAVLRRNRLVGLVAQLEDNDQFRSMLASLGALLFTVGFVLQMVATFGKP